jgi:hypothetical protein
MAESDTDNLHGEDITGVTKVTALSPEVLHQLAVLIIKNK